MGEVGKLNVCVYGARDEANGWQETLSKQLTGLGFRHGKGHPAVFHHEGKGIMNLVHGDDYVSAGWSEVLDWLQSSRNNMRSKLSGPGAMTETRRKIISST